MNQIFKAEMFQNIDWSLLLLLLWIIIVFIHPYLKFTALVSQVCQGLVGKYSNQLFVSDFETLIYQL